MDRWQTFLRTLFASVFLWLGVVAAKLVGADEGMFGFTVFAAFGGNVALWLVWAFTVYGDSEDEGAASEKAKRGAERPDDARIRLLLELMDEDDRRALKQRLMDEVTADGEVVPLAELLAAQEDAARRAAGR